MNPQARTAGGAGWSIELETAKQLVELARRYLVIEETAKAAHALARAEQMVIAVAKRQAAGNSQN